MGKIKESKWTYVVLSLMLAMILWLYVTTTLNPEQNDSLRDVQVVFVGTDIMEQRGLMISEGEVQTLNLYVRAKKDVLVKLNNNPITVEVDVSGIQSPGYYTQGGRPIYTLAGVASSQVNIITPSPLNIQFTVSRRAERSIPVEGRFSGSIQEGYQMQEFSITPAEIIISGREEDVNQVDRALVTVNREELAQTFNGEVPFTLVDAEGTPLEGLNIASNVSTVQVTLPVVQLKQVPVKVDIIPGGGATEENVELLYGVDKRPEMSITVAGSATDLEGLNEIVLGSIDLQKIFSGSAPTKLEFTIDLDPSLTNVSGNATVTVWVQITGLATRIVEVDNIEVINPPEGYVATAVTETRQVQIRGSQEAVDSVSPSQLRIVADLTDIPLATGNQTWPVKVYLDGSSDVGVVGDYNISISLTQ